MVRSGGTEQRAVCGNGSWVKGRMALGQFPSGRLAMRQFPEQAAACCGAWTNEDTFRAQVCFIEAPYYVALQLKFAGDQYILDSEMNVGFGPTRQTQMTGRLTP